MSGWEQTHRRYRLVYAVAEDVARRGIDGLEQWWPEIQVEYGGLEAFLLDVRRRWDLAVEAHIDDVPWRDVESVVAKANRPLWTLWTAFVGHPVFAGTRRSTAIA